MNNLQLILASTSPYRCELLKRLGIPFITASPDIDETPFPGENAKDTSSRLAIEKTKAVSRDYPNALIIGSDQVALCEEVQIGKPMTHENAVRQLKTLQGKAVFFYTSLAMLNSSTGKIQSDTLVNKVIYRHLTEEQIENYLKKEKPYNCAGSAKSEGLGIALIQSMEGDDPNALIGLPLISLTTMLANEKIRLF